MIEPWKLALLVIAAFVAGLVDAIAGGGGLITLPALLAANIPLHLALGTNKGQSVFGSGAAMIAYARKGALERKRSKITFPLGLVGSLLGASAVVLVPPATLRPIVLVLLPLAASTLLIPRRERAGTPPEHALVIAAALALTIGAYDGFFGPGCGTFLVIGFSMLLHDSLLRATAAAKVVNFASNLAAVAIFAWHGDILWRVSLPMAAAQMAGSWTGAHLAVRGGDRIIRPVVFLVVLGLVTKLAWDTFHG